MPQPILVIYAHPAPHLSRVNRQLADAARAIDGVTVHDLYDTYPDFYIDAAAEQARLAEAGTVVFLHPIQWYSMPSLLKEWVDAVLQSGWAHGPGGTALAGKTYWLVASTGSPQSAYAPGALHARPFDDYLPQFRQTAALCGMHWEPPLILHGAHQASDAALARHIDTFSARLRALAATPTRG
ncbi:NAD(P)H-dependent oxidoreductase [Massilia sp. PAMC28688]|uniref:glutathione-regulated potassium-efflux system oxidoreductase KefF n=1 Tax=Massilia sp. PAMC28688 TaxID=2861283 RepID=UPI001C62B8BC|nr:NAD(P)H-dependent oxidoreductase [Massilia sp. PAMC28688]QYF93436.1 NAD(P)H-dependent oxidoreductase [Massilia sp. PAMC28688]